MQIKIFKKDKIYEWPRCNNLPKFIGEVNMPKFKVGDRVRIKEKPYCPHDNCTSCFIGQERIIKERPGQPEELGVFETNERMWCSRIELDHVELISEGQMGFPDRIILSKYDELKQRIEALKDGWNKEADDILQEILLHLHCSTEHFPYLRIAIPIRNNDPVTDITIIENGEKNTTLHGFNYHSQCEKMTAFKNALLWLLDHSDIKKDIVGQEVKADIEGKIYKVKVLSEG